MSYFVLASLLYCYLNVSFSRLITSVGEASCFFCYRLLVFLAHLSRRLIGELIVYKGIRRPSVCQHFQTTSPLKPLGRFFSYFTYSIYRSGERIIVFLFRSDRNSGCYGNL